MSFCLFVFAIISNVNLQFNYEWKDQRSEVLYIYCGCYSCRIKINCWSIENCLRCTCFEYIFKKEIIRLWWDETLNKINEQKMSTGRLHWVHSTLAKNKRNSENAVKQNALNFEYTFCCCFKYILVCSNRAKKSNKLITNSIRSEAKRVETAKRRTMQRNAKSTHMKL